MPMWRCPHCGTPQAETARCWVCRRSSTACGTCQNFRRSVAGQIGYCGLDRHRRPLDGDEIRPCWESRPITREEPAPGSGPWIGAIPPLEGSRTSVRRLEFVEVRPPVDTGPTRAHERSDTRDPAGEPVLSPAEPGWSLWGGAEF
jgi:hypothetical protein